MQKRQIITIITALFFLAGCSSENPNLPKGNPYKMIQESTINNEPTVIEYLYDNKEVTAIISDGDTTKYYYLDEGEYRVQMMSQGTGVGQINSKTTKDGTKSFGYYEGKLMWYTEWNGNVIKRNTFIGSDTLTHIDTIPDESNKQFTFDQEGNITSGPGFKNTWYYN